MTDYYLQTLKQIGELIRQDEFDEYGRLRPKKKSVLNALKMMKIFNHTFITRMAKNMIQLMK